MGNSGIIFSEGYLPPKGQDNILQRIPGRLRAEIKLQVRKQQLPILTLSLPELLIDFVAFVFLSLGGLDFLQLIPLIGGIVLFKGWVGQVQTGVEFEVHEFQQHSIEIQESHHNPIIDIDGQIGRILERNNIRDLLAKYLALVVNPLDADEGLAEGVRADDVKLEVFEQLRAEFHFVAGQVELLVRREDGEEGHQRQGVVQVAQGVHEFRVSLTHQVAQSQFWLVLGQVADLADVALGLGFFVFFEVNFLPTDFLDQRVKSHEVDVLEVVVAATGLLEFLGGFAGVDALEDAELSEIFERELQLADGLCAADVLHRLAPLPGFYLAHAIVDYN